MPEYLIDLLAWGAFFVVFFFGLRWVQNRKKDKDEPPKDP